MLKNTKSLWPLVSRSLKSSNRPIRTMLISPRSASRHTIQPMHIYRPFTTTIVENVTPTTTITHTQQSDWNKYLDQISNIKEHPMTKQDFIDICTATQKDTELGKSEKVQRLQHILRDIHQHIDQDPELNRAFQRACNILMYVYIIQGNLKSAKLVFEGLANSEYSTVDDVSIQTIIHGIQKQSTKTDLYKFCQFLEKRGLFQKDAAGIYLSVIYAFKHFGDIRGCQFYFAEMIKHGLDNDEKCYKAMMEVYRKVKRPESVLELYHTMKEKKMQISVPLYDIVLSSLSSDKNMNADMIQVFNELKESGLKITSSTYVSMKWDPLDAIKDIKNSNMSITTRDYNEFLGHYVKRNKFPEALEVYKLMKEDDGVDMDVFSYGIIMDVLVKDLEQSPESVFDLYHEMKDYQIRPDAVVYTSLLSACNRTQDLERAMALLEEMESFGITPNAYTFNSVLSILSTMQGTSNADLDRASLIWDKMTSLGIHPNTRTYNTYLSIISKLIQPAEYNDQDTQHLAETSLWGEEENGEHVPRTVREMLRMYRYMKRNYYQTIQPDFLTYTIVINSLSAAGQLRSALQVYSDAKLSRVTLPVSSYNEIMRALQRGGKMSEAMNVWYDMKIHGVLPDSETYELVLEACEQLGLSESLTSIRNQRKSDLARLLDLDVKKEKRMKNSFNKK